MVRLHLYIFYLILDEAPDPATLVALSQTCWTLYSTYKRRELHLLKLAACRRTNMPWHVLREAITVERFNPPPIPPPLLTDPDVLRDRVFWFQDVVVEAPDLSLAKVTPKEIKRIVVLHQSVMAFLWRFIDFCSIEYGPLMESFKAKPPNAQEKDRIMIALYRNDVFGKIFVEHFEGGFEIYAVAQTYLYSGYSRWELAQVGCVNAFLSGLMYRRTFSPTRPRTQIARAVHPLNRPWNRYDTTYDIVNRGLGPMEMYLNDPRPQADSPFLVKASGHGFRKFHWAHRKRALMYNEATPMHGNLDQGSLRGDWEAGDYHRTNMGQEMSDAGRQALWGYIFWDKERLESLDGWTMPRSSTMPMFPPIEVPRTETVYPSGIVATLWPDGDAPGL